MSSYISKKLGLHGYCLNALFYLYMTKPKFRTTSRHWISTFYSVLETLRKYEQIPQFKQRNFVQIENTFRYCKVCKYARCIICHIQRNFSFLHTFCNFAINSWNFANLQFFLQIIKVKPRAFQKCIYLYLYCIFVLYICIIFEDISLNKIRRKVLYRVSQKTWEFSDVLDIVFVMNQHCNT